MTSLRGFSFEYEPSAETSIKTSFAAPKDLWQEYSDVDNIISATRLKHKVSQDLSIGATYTSRTGFNLDEGSKTSSQYKTELRGNAYYFSVIGRYPRRSI
ncbi:MAG: hypothetical protein ABIH40_02695 [Candidatus Omnitrophota bacterium]